MNPQILIADDDPVAQKVLRTILQQAGYTVQSANDGETALRTLLQPDAPLIAIVDWMMPGLNGPDLCTKLRAINLRLRPYIIMLSGKADKAEIAAALDAGADDYLSKPFNRMEFLARLRVAGRMVQAQIKLQKYIAHLESRARPDSSPVGQATPPPVRPQATDTPQLSTTMAEAAPPRNRTHRLTSPQRFRSRREPTAVGANYGRTSATNRLRGTRTSNTVTLRFWRR
jgi:DNA-binding response OmpR family regulator